jgi:predicted MFS family arabinose efflux permease
LRAQHLGQGVTADDDPRRERSAVRMLQACSVTSSFDRFVVGPMLLTVATDLDEPLSDAAAAASAYFLLYGLSQPVWGLLSDRLGRVRLLRLTLALAAVGGALSALAPSLPLLVVARAVTGACMGAVVPSGLVYVGDAVPYARRQRTLTDLNAATAIGITAATALGGVLAAALSWRVAFLLPALSAAALVAVLRRLPEPPRSAMHQGGLGTVLRHRWGLTVLALALVEGSALLGLLAYLAPALESTGSTPTVAGAVVGLYGVGLLLASRVVKRLAGRTRPPVFLAVGASGLLVAYTAVAVSQEAVVVGPAALLVGAAWAAMHSTMQAWATEVVPEARAGMVSLFAGMLFVGSGVATAVLAPWAGAFRWAPVYGTGAGLALVFGVAAVAGRSAYGQPAQVVPPPVVGPTSDR